MEFEIHLRIGRGDFRRKILNENRRDKKDFVTQTIEWLYWFGTQRSAESH